MHQGSKLYINLSELVEMRHKLAFLLAGIIASAITAGCINNVDSRSTSEYSIAYIADGRPSQDESKSMKNLKQDFDQIIPQSPTKRVDAVIMLGDMDYITETSQAYAESTAKNIPVFYVAGNHELDNKVDLAEISKKFAIYDFNPVHGPTGSGNTTYSFNAGDVHIVVLNEYWDGNDNGICDWFVPDGGINADDACFRYSTSDGGFIPDALFTWLEDDLKNNARNWTVVVAHEPLYPQKRHVGTSLDKNVTNRDRLESLFIQYNVTAFVGAHTHISSMKTINGIFHIDAGVSGIQTLSGSGDSFASIIYTTVNSSGYFKITHVEENPTWAKSKSTALGKR